jgi:hypothetical protein
MPWSYRGNRKYFTLATRVGRRIVHEYLGAGDAAIRAAAEIEQRRAERLTRAEEVLLHRQHHDEASAHLNGLAHLTELLAKGTLIALGYHQHDRTWRKRRDHPLHK